MTREEHTQFRQELSQLIKGELSFDDHVRAVYATDASIYQIMPLGVMIPLDDEDVIHTVRLAAKYRVNLLPRGSGTSLGGQAAGAALVIDFTKYMNRVLEFNLKERWVRVQPGMVLDELNEFLKPYKLHFAPDPATSNRATIGGMIGNNSSGARSILYGITKDHILETKTLLSDGSVHTFRDLPLKSINGSPENLNAREAELLEGLKSIIDGNRSEIRKVYPKIMRRVQGYNLDSFIDTDSWNLSNLMCGSEGTLGIVLSARLRLEPLPQHKVLCAVHFNDLLDCIRNVAPMVGHEPSAVEIMDKDLIRTARSSPTIAPLCDWIEGDPKGMLIVEFFGDSRENAWNRAEALKNELRQKKIGYAWPVIEDTDLQAKVWKVRKNGLGIMMRIEGEAKPIGFIEDAAVPLEFLPEYIDGILDFCKEKDVQVIMYAHASVGLIHVRPVLDLKNPEGIGKMKLIARRSFELVRKYNGSISGEHGDGRTRSPFLEEFFGPQVYSAFKELKKLFDPAWIMNPGVIVDPAPIDANLRYGEGYQAIPLETVYHYRDEGSFASAVETCTGVGVCRQNLGGLMCPSYRATRDEEHSTRGRANALRMTMTGQLGQTDFSDPSLFEIMDLCLSCKGCKSECPSNVDVARLKSEYLNQYRKTHHTSLREHFVSLSARMAGIFSGWMAPLINAVQRTLLFRKILEWMAGIDSRRILPGYSRKRFHAWFRKRETLKKRQHSGTDEHSEKTRQSFDGKPAGGNKSKKVVLFDDTYMNYHQVNVGISAVELLESCGYEVILAEAGCCQRPRISHGFLDKARKEGEKTLRNLEKYIDQGLKVVVCEPGCASALTDDLPDMMVDESLARIIKENVFMIDVFLDMEISAGRTAAKFSSPYESLMIHGHCHQKSLYGTESMEKLLRNVDGLKLEILDSGCCGMAGSFGYEKEHYDISMKVGEDRLFPAIRAKDRETRLVACGFSCRHQITDATGEKPLHWVEVLRGIREDRSVK